jgi:hypothetical protein
LDKYFKSYIDETFGGPDKALAPGNVEEDNVDGHKPQT